MRHRELVFRIMSPTLDTMCLDNTNAYLRFGHGRWRPCTLAIGNKRAGHYDGHGHRRRAGTASRLLLTGVVLLILRLHSRLEQLGKQEASEESVQAFCGLGWIVALTLVIIAARSELRGAYQVERGRGAAVSRHS